MQWNSDALVHGIYTSNDTNHNYNHIINDVTMSDSDMYDSLTLLTIVLIMIPVIWAIIP